MREWERVEYESRWVLVAFEKHQNYPHKYNKNSLSGAVAVSVAASMASDWKDDNPLMGCSAREIRSAPAVSSSRLLSTDLSASTGTSGCGVTGVKNPEIVFNLLSASFSRRCLSFFSFLLSAPLRYRLSAIILINAAARYNSVKPTHQ